jgi:hypothetical protein
MPTRESPYRRAAIVELLLRTAVAFQNVLVEFILLVRDAVCRPLFVLAAGCACRLLNQLTKVVSAPRCDRRVLQAIVYRSSMFSQPCVSKLT